jgi:intracellular multiplication protein IcmE
MKAGFIMPAETPTGCSAADISSAKMQGVSAKELKNRGCEVASLMQGGFSGAELAQAGFSLDEIAAKQAAGAASQPSWEAKLQTIRDRQAQELSAQDYKDKLKSIQQSMSTQTSDLFSSWIPLPAQQFVQGAEKAAAGQATEGGGAAAGRGGQQAVGKGGPVDIFKAGSVMFAVLDTGVNSDEKSPVMATIIEGPLNGAKLLGSFQRVEQKVVLQFNVLNVPYVQTSVPINAVAIDPNTAKTALATSVDNHYMLRYGTLFAASFMSGVGQAVQNSGNSVTVNTSTGENVNLNGSVTATKAAVIGLGEVGNKMASAWQPMVNRPPTIEVKAGSGIGLLLMSDLSVPQKSQAVTQ